MGLAAAAVFLIAFARLWAYVLDDTYISLRYAQNLVQGQGLVYNPGERVEGYSNFLWTVFLALPYALHLPPLAFLKISLALAALATAWLTVRLGIASGLTTAGAGERWLAWGPGWLVLLTPLVVIRTADGLETVPFTLLLVMAVTWAFEARDSGRFTRLGLALAGLTLIRPDGVLFAPLVLSIVALRGARPRRIVIAALVCVVPVVTQVLARHAYYGDWLPNTFYAKRGGSEDWLNGWRSLLVFLAETGGWAWLALLPALAWRRTRAVAWMLMAVVATRMAFHVWAGGAWIGRHRFLVPTLPLLYVIVAGGLAGFGGRAARPFAAAVVGVLLLVPAWLRYPEVERDRMAYGRGLTAAHGALGLAVNARTAPDAVIAMGDAGLTPYLAHRRTVDMLGLNDRHIGRLPGRFGHKFDVAYVLARRPDLIVLVSTVADPTTTAQIPLASDRAMAVDSVFRARYRRVHVYTMRPDYHLEVFRRRDSWAVLQDFR
ncbi:MAG: hypothetical protein ACRENJ_04745 [Candidatus Eiseniibacteriota bacterium]